MIEVAELAAICVGVICAVSTFLWLMERVERNLAAATHHHSCRCETCLPPRA